MYSQPPLWIDEILMDVGDTIEKEYSKASNWVLSLFEYERELPKYCEICGATKGLERHHIAGRKHDSRVVLVCKECHQHLSAKQNLWGEEWLKRGLPTEKRHKFFLRGLIDILELKAYKTQNFFYERFAREIALRCFLLGGNKYE